MTLKKTVGVYLGAKNGNNKAFETSVIQLGEGLVKFGYDLVYGGASIGLMGLLAKTVKSNGGHVIGIITKHLLDEEIAFHQADELIVVDSMYDRKKLIHEKSSRFIMMPGGLGTFDEFFETWCQIKIGVMKKHIGLVNIDGYFNTLFQFINECSTHGFLSESSINIPKCYQTVFDCLDDMVIANKSFNIQAEVMV